MTGGVDERLPRGPVSGQHRLWRDGWAGVRDHGGGDGERPREAQRQLVRGARRWDVASGLKKQAQIDELIAFFRARRGKAYGFRFKDWTDFKATGQLVGTGDGALAQFQLVKHYPSGSVISFHSVVDLQAAINRYIAEHNDDPKPFTWTKTTSQILVKLNHLNASVH